MLGCRSFAMSIVYVFNVCGHGLILFALWVNWFVLFWLGWAGLQHGCLGPRFDGLCFCLGQIPFSNSMGCLFLDFESVYKIWFEFGFSSFIV